MSADPFVYASERVARAYASTRPPIHPLVWQRAVAALHRTQPWASALDIGCGGGASTAALVPHASKVCGIDIFAHMVAHAGAAVPRATFEVASAEALPFDAASFDLVSAAGSLNYTDIDTSMAEIGRVLAPGGHFVPYDFSTGRRLRDDARLAEHHAVFRERFPAPPGYGLDLSALPYAEHAMQRLAYEEFDVEVPMTGSEYVAYLMADAGVEATVVSGLPADDAQRWLGLHFGPVFGVERRGVLFNVQLVLAHKPAAG
jgi:ubiquinone/menaquinone biosynthesis C-methylase UbiE